MSVADDSTAPLISAVIPTYRRPRLLRRAISSVLAQEGVPLRVCVYDNASGDDTPDVVASLASSGLRLHYHCHSKNIGAAANFEFGLQHVDTPFFSILSDDDYLLPGFYQHALDGLTAHPEAMFWAGLVINVDADGMIWDARVGRWPREGLFMPPEGFMAMTGGMAPTWTGIVFRREALELEGLPNFEILGPADLEYCLRLAARHPYVVEKHPSAAFMLNNASFSATQPLSSFWPGWQSMMRNFENSKWLDGDFKKAALDALRRDAHSMLFRRGANALAAGRLDFARHAASALALDCGLPGRASVLRIIAKMCASNTIAQRAYTASYRLAERRIIRARRDLQDRYGDLLRAS